MRRPSDPFPSIPGLYRGNATVYTTKDGVEVTVIPPLDIPRMFRVAVYCRVSTTHTEQQESLEAQLSYYKDYVHHHRAWVFVGAYADTKSGRSIHARDQLKQMISDCMEDKIDIVITKTVSRFGRNTAETISLLRKLSDKGIDVFFENEGLHSIDGKDELLISLMEAIAQAESESRSQNIKWGIKQQAKKTNAPIYSRPCFGYRKSDDGALAIFEDEAKAVRSIFDLYMAGGSVLAIKKDLEDKGVLTPTGKTIWSKRTIETILKNEKYVGDVIIYKTFCSEYPQTKRIRNHGEQERYGMSDHHPAIIEREVFDSVQEEIKRRSNIITDENGIARRKATHYSVKKNTV